MGFFERIKLRQHLILILANSSSPVDGELDAGDAHSAEITHEPRKDNNILVKYNDITRGQEWGIGKFIFAKIYPLKLLEPDPWKTFGVMG